MAAKESITGGLGNIVKIVPMNKRHLPQVQQIEKVSFPSPWSKNTYLKEIKENQFAHYLVCLMGEKVVGYAGMWLIVDEAHITTIAVKPEFRGKDLGKRLLTELLGRAILLGADKATLEVRPSNEAAQALYKQMGFVSVGRRKGYYSDTQEDAIVMWKSLLVYKEV